MKKDKEKYIDKTITSLELAGEYLISELKEIKNKIVTVFYFDSKMKPSGCYIVDYDYFLKNTDTFLENVHKAGILNSSKNCLFIFNYQDKNNKVIQKVIEKMDNLNLKNILARVDTVCFDEEKLMSFESKDSLYFKKFSNIQNYQLLKKENNSLTDDYGLIELKDINKISNIKNYTLGKCLSVIKDELCDYDKEYFSIATIDGNDNLINYSTVAIGGINFTGIEFSSILKVALISNAKKIVAFHNHPSGDLTPSNEDIDITNRLDSVLKYFDIKLLDHLILNSKGEFNSILKNNIFSTNRKNEIIYNQESINRHLIRGRE